MASLPAYVKVVMDGYTQSPESVVSRTEMESGPPKQLLARSRPMIPRNVVFLIRSKEDYVAFLAWFRDEINYGVDWFDYTDPFDGVTKEARIVAGKIEPSLQKSNFAMWKVGCVLESWGT
jgi:hypothetical protein